MRQGKGIVMPDDKRPLIPQVSQKDSQGADDKDKKGMRHRVMMNPSEIGLTARIRRALLEPSSVTQQIRMAMVRKVQDQNSFFYMKSNHFIIIGSLLVILILFGYLAFKSRIIDVKIVYPSGESRTLSDVAVSLFEGTKKLDVPDYPRQLTVKRYDVYGDDLSEDDFKVINSDKQEVDHKKLLPGTYTLKITKKDYKTLEIPLEIGKTNLEKAVKLEPLVETKRELKLYVDDPLEQDQNIEPDAVFLVTARDKDKESIKNKYMKPGKYSIRVEKAGYIGQEIELDIPESGRVEKKIPLQYQSRSVKMLVDDGLTEKGYEPEVAMNEIKLYQEGKLIPFKKEQGIMPGWYDLDVERDGYYPYKTRIKIPAGADLFALKVPLKPQERQVAIVPNYDVAPANLRPDKAYLTDLTASNKDVIPITDGLRVYPGWYWVKVEKANYHPYSAKVQITPSTKAYEIKAHLISVSKQILLKITSDYDVEPNVNPDELMVDMRIAKPGYFPIQWGNLKGAERMTEESKYFQIQSLEPEKKDISVPVFLETRLRRVVCNITSDMGPGPVQPDLATMTRIMDGKPVGNLFDIKKDELIVKPGRYMIEIKKVGFEDVKQEHIIDPKLQAYQMNIELKAKLSQIIVQTDSDYEPGIEARADSMMLDREPAESGTRRRPGAYTILLKKDGFYPIERVVKIDPGVDPIFVKEQFKAKPRRVVYEITGKKFDKIVPDSVLLDRSPIREFQEVPPKKAYEARIEKRGYQSWKGNFDILPSDKEYTLKAQILPLKRKVELVLEASFPKGKDLLPANEATIGIQPITNDTEVEPDKYSINIVKDGYKPINKTVEVTPDDAPFKIYEIMYPKEREIRTEVAYDVRPENSNITNVVQVESEDKSFPLKELKPGDRIEPNKYKLSITAEGYEKLTDNVEVLPAETVHSFKYTLISLPRTVSIKLSSDYLQGSEVTPEKVLFNGKPFSERMSMVEKIKPGLYSVYIEAIGYHPIQKEVFIPASVNDFVLTENLTTIPRIVICKFYDAEKPTQEVDPATGKVLLDDTPVAQQNTKFKPKKYRFSVSIPCYKELTEDIVIEPMKKGDESEQVVITRRLIPESRLVKYELTGDYDNNLLTPKEITLNSKPVLKEGSGFMPGVYELNTFVPGYERLQKRIEFSSSKDTFTIREKLNSKPVMIVFNITGTYPEGSKITPDKVWLSDPDNPPADSTNLPTLVDGQQLLPKLSGYQVKMEKEGYLPATTILKFPPSEVPFDFTYKLTAVPRKLVFEIDSDFKRGSMMKLEEISSAIQIDEVGYNAETMYAPGTRKIIINKAGYQTDSFEQVIPTGDGPFLVRRTLTALPRQVLVRVMSEFTKQEMNPEVCTLGNRRPDEGTYKPSEYELSLGHSGYLDIRKNVTIEPGEGLLELEYTLIPKNRKIRPVITYDRTPRKGSPEPSIKLRNVDTGEEFRLKESDEIKAAEYMAYFEKEGFELGQKPYAIEPGDKPYDLAFEMVAKPVEILIDITYDIQPPTNLDPYTVSFIDERGQPIFVSHGRKIKPGNFTLEIKRPGYMLPNQLQKITVMPGIIPFSIKEKMIARPRPLSFDMTFGGLIVKAVEVLVDDKKAEAKDTFKPGQEYQLIAKFKEYKTAKSKVTIPPGEGAFVANLDLVPLKKFEFKIGRRFFENKGMTLSPENIKYNLEIFADREVVEPHQLIETESSGLARGEFYAAKDSRRIRMEAGFYYDEVEAMSSDTGVEMDFRDLRRIEAAKLLEHLKHVQKESAENVVVRMEALLNDRQDKPKIAALTREDKDTLKNFMRELKLSDSAMQKKCEAVVSALSK